MKMRFSTSFPLLAVALLGGVLCFEITEEAPEHGVAVVSCNYSAEYENNLKYFCKRTSSGCETFISSSGVGKEGWTLNGRIFLFDDTEKKKFEVTINNLIMEDTGLYSCGIEGAGLVIAVHLTVNKGAKPSSTTSTSIHAAEATCPPAEATRTGSDTASTGNLPQPTESHMALAFIVIIGGCFGGVLLLLLCVFFGLRCRENAGDVHFYEDVSHSGPVEPTVSVSVSGTPWTDPPANPPQAHMTVNSTVTDPKQDPHRANPSPTHHVPPMDLVTSSCREEQSQTSEGSKEPSYYQLDFLSSLNPSDGSNATHSSVETVQHSIYSLIVAPVKTSESDYDTVMLSLN